MSEFEREKLTQRLREAMGAMEKLPKKTGPDANLDTEYLQLLLESIDHQLDQYKAADEKKLQLAFRKEDRLDAQGQQQQSRPNEDVQTAQT